MRAEKYIDRAQLESNIQAQRIPHKLLRDALNILEMDNKYLKIWKEKKEGWTKSVDKKFVLSFGLFDIKPQDIYKALHFLQWIPLTDEYGEYCYENKNLTLEGCFYRICIRQADGTSPYGEEVIFDLWRYTHKDEVRLFLKEYLENNKETSFDIAGTINNKITLKINKVKMEISKDNNTLVCSFRKVGGKNRRFEYICKLAISKTKIGSKKLRDKTFQNTSGEIDKINDRLIKDLDLTEKVIKNKGNSGYEINREIYEIIFS